MQMIFVRNINFCYPEGKLRMEPATRFARQNRYEPPPEFPLASPYSGIVHHLSGPNKYAPAQTLGRIQRPADRATETVSHPILSLRTWV